MYLFIDYRSYRPVPVLYWTVLPLHVSKYFNEAKMHNMLDICRFCTQVNKGLFKGWEPLFVLRLPRCLFTVTLSLACSYFNSLPSASPPLASHMYKHHRVVAIEPQNESQPLSTSTFPRTPYGARWENMESL